MDKESKREIIRLKALQDAQPATQGYVKKRINELGWAMVIAALLLLFAIIMVAVAHG